MLESDRFDSSKPVFAPTRAATLALAAAALFVAACSKGGESSEAATAANPPEAGGEAAASGDVKCLGINECKGQAQCGGAPGGHSCAGQNECKGKGWIKVSAAECTEKGGTAL